VLIVRYHNAVALLGATAVMTFFSALSTAAVFVSFSESLRKEVRVMGMGTVYATAVAVFGGTTQNIVLALIHYTGDPVSPAWYMMAATAVGLWASVAMKETAHGRTPAQ
jgi:hypothetical protein